MELKKGEKIKITLIEGDEYEGTIQQVNSKTGRISLSAVKDLSNDNVYDFLHHYQRNEIRNIEIIAENNTKKSSPKIESPSNETEVFDEFKDISEYKFKLPKYELERLQLMKKNVQYFSRANQDFHSVVKNLKACENLAIDAKHVDHGRDSEMSLLVIASWCTVYVFDIKLMRQETFKNGINDIFENENILKIFHNGVKIVDCLKNRFHISVKNITDTQIIDMVIRHKRTKQNNLRTLSECMTSYLNAPCNFIDEESHFPKWNERPVPELLRRKVGERVTYLITLYNIMQCQLHNDFYDKVNAFMNSMSKLDPGQAFYVLTRPENGQYINKIIN